MKTTAICMIAMMLFCGIAEARSSSLYSRTYGFRSSSCKSSSCFSKHPSGSRVHPLTRRKYD
jgi:hypothetical protein